jgi:hypothetical protein
MGNRQKLSHHEELTRQPVTMKNQFTEKKLLRLNREPREYANKFKLQNLIFSFRVVRIFRGYKFWFLFSWRPRSATTRFACAFGYDSPFGRARVSRLYE